MILIIDNYDSFTYNLLQILEALGHEVKVFRNDRITLEEIEKESPEALIISPGPCTPQEAGISVGAIRLFGPRIPVLGVCLGHQAIAAAYGGKVVKAERILHGKTSFVFHDQAGMYSDLPNPFEAMRYHSLVVERASLPDCLEVTSWTQEGEVMGIRHRSFAVEGVQFHPESIMTPSGHKMLQAMFR